MKTVAKFLWRLADKVSFQAVLFLTAIIVIAIMGIFLDKYSESYQATIGLLCSLSATFLVYVFMKKYS